MNKSIDEMQWYISFKDTYLYRWTYLRGRNRDTDIEKGRVDTVGGKEGRDELGD